MKWKGTAFMLLSASVVDALVHIDLVEKIAIALRRLLLRIFRKLYLHPYVPDIAPHKFISQAISLRESLILSSASQVQIS